MNKNNLIINADDFGYNHNINSAIISCFQKEYINSTTIMANMEGFEEAVNLAKQHGITNKIGLHINLSEGKPLTDLSGTGLIDKNGLFIRKAISNPYIFFSKSLKDKIRNEIEQQYNKLISTGIVPTHFDSHHHVHTILWVAGIFIEFAKHKKKKIRLVNDRFRKNIVRWACYKLLNKQYKVNRINFSDKFRNVEYFIKHYKSKHKNLSYEIMVHPAFNNKVLFDSVDNAEMEELINSVNQCIYRENN